MIFNAAKDLGQLSKLKVNALMSPSRVLLISAHTHIHTCICVHPPKNVYAALSGSPGIFPKLSPVHCHLGEEMHYGGTINWCLQLCWTRITVCIIELTAHPRHYIGTADLGWWNVVLDSYSAERLIHSSAYAHVTCGHEYKFTTRDQAEQMPKLRPWNYSVSGLFSHFSESIVAEEVV